MDVGDWLRSLGLGQYAGAFRDNAIDGEVLPKLTAEDLKDLGVAIVGHRRIMLSAIEALSASPYAPPSVAKPAHAASSPAAPRVAGVDAERRPITVLFCDLVGSTSLAAKLDAEDWRDLVGGYLDEASAAVTGLSGHVLKKLGDGLMALFGYPHAQENDAERAVRAALAIQRALADLNARNTKTGAPELAARIGLDMGPVVVDAAGEVFGDAPNLAARVQGAAEPGTVLVTQAVQRQIAGLFVAEDKGEHQFKGAPAPMTLYRIVRASGAGRRGGGRTLTPLVGREDELSLLMRRWARALQGEGQFVQIVGEPGIGKSRLIEEFRRTLAETPHTWVQWDSSQLLHNTPLHPLADWGRQRFGGAEVAAERRLADLESTLRLTGLDAIEYAPLVAPLVDVPLPADRVPKLAPEELRRRQLAALTAWFLASARSQAVALAFEDLHWADPTTLDLLRALAERCAQAPLFIVATTRPEFRPPWSLRPHHSVIALAPLDRAGVARMVGEIASRHALPKDVIDGVSERTGGVPLFVEEVTRLLLEGGAQAIPPTLQQSLAARLDRLGPAREIAQFGAVLGRDFTFALLQGLSGLDETGLHSALERLAEADLLIVDGGGPQANYRFKHALIQDAAYESLLKSRRQALHRRAAEVLRNLEAEPEAIAHHFTQAGFDDLAIEWWGKAGDQALRRSAFQEAIAHLGKAIEMADKAGESGSTGQRLKLQSSYGLALTWSRGSAAEETRAATARIKQLAAEVRDPAARWAVYYGQWVPSVMGGQTGSAQLIAETYLAEAKNAAALPDIALASRMLGHTNMLQGVFKDARAHLEETLGIYDPEWGIDVKRGQVDSGIGATVVLSLVSWQLGEVERARGLIEQAKTLADESRHGLTLAVTYFFASMLEMFRGDAEATLRDAEILTEIAASIEVSFFSGLAKICRAWARARLGDGEGGSVELRQGLAELVEQKALLAMPAYQGLLAEFEAERPNPDRALAQIDEALALGQRTGQLWTDAFLHRIRGDILLKADPENPARAEEAYFAAIGVARAQSARSFGLQAALSLAKLYRSTGRPAEAHDALAPALEGFSPTPEMPEIAEAQELLAALAETGEVKAAASQRQRRTQLRVAYGNALIAARGYGARETTEAFAKARESAYGEGDAPERLAADYGLWAGSCIRGELPSMRTRAAAFLCDVGARPQSPEAGVAHRANGITHLFAGEYVEARNHLERALALFQPGRDDDLAFRFGYDAGVAAMLHLAFALWPLGDVARAVSLVGGAQARIAGLAHIGSHASGKMTAALFELMRGDRSRAALNAVELAQLGREHDLLMWGAFGVFLEGLAEAERGAPGGGLADMRRGVELLRDLNILIFDGLIKIALAEAEAHAGDVGRALAILDEALATSDRIGHRTFDAELNRMRGEILLKIAPSNHTPAEAAFQAAIAVASAQVARSFVLRAALSLAKLYQSTARAAEARAVLAPALEGFAPTPEMPEIAEAQALLAALQGAAKLS